jgi:hypothetical protein
MPDQVSLAPVIFGAGLMRSFCFTCLLIAAAPLRRRVTAALAPSLLRYVAASQHQEGISA